MLGGMTSGSTSGSTSGGTAQPESDLVPARQALHAIAECLLAGHQWRTIGTIRLTVTPTGFTTREMIGAPSRLAVEGTDVIRDPDGLRVPIAGTLLALADRLGVGCGAPDGLYAEGTGCPPVPVTGRLVLRVDRRPGRPA